MGAGSSTVAAPADAGIRPASDRAAATAAVEPEALVVTHWFDSGEAGEPYSATVRFTGSRAGVHGKPRAQDHFVHDEAIDRIVPGTGPVSITATVNGLQPGEWSVSAQLVRVSGADGGPHRSIGARPVRPASWSWRRWSISTRPDPVLKTRWALLAPLARTPAVMPGVYTALAVVGMIVALAVQSAILAREDVSVERSLTASLLAIGAGLIAAKLWYAVLHPDESIIRGGWAVDGFLVMAPVVAVTAVHAFELPMGVVLDAATPGLFFAVALGRVGCFVTGCCAGRCTSSRWGIWSSDRRVGARRIPTQLLEAAAGLAIGVVSMLLVLGHALPVHGLTFVAAFALYTVVRQILLRLRAEHRRSARTIPLTAGAAAAVLIAVAVMSTVERSEPPSHSAGVSGALADTGSPASYGSFPG